MSTLAVFLILMGFVVVLSVFMAVIFYREEKRRKQYLHEKEKLSNVAKDDSKHEKSNM